MISAYADIAIKFTSLSGFVIIMIALFVVKFIANFSCTGYYGNDQ